MSETGHQLIRAAVDELRDVGVNDATGDARRLLAFAMGCDAAALSARLVDAVDPEHRTAFFDAVEQRVTRKPVSQIIGSRQFWDIELCITQDVLDPRPETEILVETALRQPFDRVLDLGVGSGCILISLLKSNASATGLGVDNSAEALEIAFKNAQNNDVVDRTELLESEWFATVEGSFDLIVANPPYIAMAEMEQLSPEVRMWEPIWALTPGPSGLESYEQIAAGIYEHLTPGGRLLLETGPTQAGDVKNLFIAAGLSFDYVVADLDGRDRVVQLHRAP